VIRAIHLAQDSRPPSPAMRRLECVPIGPYQPRVGMVWPQRLLTDDERALVQRLGRGVLALVAIEQRQVSPGT